MIITNTKVAFLEESLLAAGFPKAVLYDDIKKQAADISKVYDRGIKLGNAPVGSGHDCFLKGIRVQADVFYTQYWSMQFQRYHFSDIVSSQSKMHKIIEMGLSYDNVNGHVEKTILDIVNDLIKKYKEAVEIGSEEQAHTLFLRIMANIPMGFKLWMRIDINYLQLKTIYLQRYQGDAKRLPNDWGVFCDWCLTLPYFKKLCLGSIKQ